MEINEPLKAKALDMMVEGKKQVFIAKTLDVSTRTIRRWAADPGFAKELKEEREAVNTIGRVQSAVAYLKDIEESIASNNFLSQIRDNDRAPIAVRMRAAVMLMNQGHKTATLMLREEREEKRRAEKADKSGHRGMTVPAMSIHSNSLNPATSLMSDLESGQNRPNADTPEEAAARQAALEIGEAELRKLDELEKTVKSKKKEIKPAAFNQFEVDLENARQAIENTMGAIDEAPADQLKTITYKPAVVAVPAA